MTRAARQERSLFAGRRASSSLVRAGLLVLLGLPAHAGDEPGEMVPVEIREAWLLAQGRLQLPIGSPDVVATGRLHVALELGLGNDFGWDQDVPGETPHDRRFLVDGEHGHATLALRRGLAPRLDAEARLGLVWRNGGFLDGSIDTWHRWLDGLGVRDNGRPAFLNDQLRVDGRADDGEPLSWEGASGSAIGNAEVALRYVLDQGPGWRTALIGRVLIPTGGQSFDAGGWDVGAQLAAGRRLSDSVELTLGMGAVRFGVTEHRGVSYVRGQVHGHAGVAWRFARLWSLYAQARGASRLVEDLADYPGVQLYLDLGVTRCFGEWRMTAGFSENVKHQQATVDFSAHLRLQRSFGGGGP